MNSGKVLIVEDEELMGRLLSEKLTESKFEVVLALDGQAGLDIALSIKPDIILLDIVIPKIDGMAVLEKIRESGDWGKNVPVIVLTNLTLDDKTMVKIKSLPPSSYIIKTDCTLDCIMEKVDKMLASVRGVKQ